MELGGKSPFVVFADADLERALDAAVFMIFSNNGERCTAGSRILVERPIYAEFAARFAERARRIAVGDPLDEKTIVGPMISRGHLEKVRGYIALGGEEGATLLCGGLDAPDLPASLRAGNFVQPTVFGDVDNRMRIAQEEIFGPVACLIAFDDEADAIAKANDIAYGLSSYVWTKDIGRAHRVAAAVEAGMCFVNSQNVRDLRQPFGGTKASGTGREGGSWSFEVFCEPKNVCVIDHRPSHSEVGRRVNATPHCGIRAGWSPSQPSPGEGARRARAMSLYGTQKFLFHLNRDPVVQRRYGEDLVALLDDYELTAEEREAVLARRCRQAVRARLQRPAADALRGVAGHAVGRLSRVDARGRAPPRAGAGGHLRDDDVDRREGRGPVRTRP